MIVVVLLIGGAGAYFFVLAPKMSVVDWSHADLPLSTSNITRWQYSYDVVVANSGYLTGQTTIVCTFTFQNGTAGGVPQFRSFEGSLRVQLKSGEQAEFTVQVILPWADAIFSMVTQNKTWSVHLA